MMDALIPITNYIVEMTIVQGRGLVAKDRHFLTRQRTTSDPFVEVFVGMDERLGRTKTCHKTLDPVWDSQFHFTVPNKRHVQVPADTSTFLQNQSTTSSEASIQACSMVLLKVYDHDEFTDHDIMGTLVVPIPVAPRAGMITKRWYKIDNLFVANAMGEIEIELNIQAVASKVTARSLLPSPDTFARWFASCVTGKQKETVNEHNVVVESDPTDRKKYILAIFKQFAE